MGRLSLHLVAVGSIVLASLGVTAASGGDRSMPPPGATLESRVAPGGSGALERLPDRALVSTLDGGILRSADGTPVTAPQGEL